MKISISGLFISAMVFSISCTQNPYEPNWESLATNNEAPQWLQEAKFGIYFHWGVYCVPAFGGEQYSRYMHFESNRTYLHHLENYGHPSEFGYNDFIPMFKAELFDADEWADLFVKAGARFAGPVAEHCDGFSMWDSEITPWNTMDMGPERDITGELSRAIKQRDMKLITTFHNARNLQKHDTARAGSARLPYHNSHYPFFEDMPTTSEDADLKLLYGNIPADIWYPEVWFGKLKEVIDNYQPDIIWFDSWVHFVPDSMLRKFCAYYLNESEKRGQEVVLVTKHAEIPLDVGIIDLEKSRRNSISESSWMTDETVSTGSWCYTEGLELKPTRDILHVLIDIVSKNGVLLFNISPKADGTIPEDQKKSLLEIGVWLETNGEAIYGTRPWYTFGEGPTEQPEEGWENHHLFADIVYTPEDVRYTTKEENIYAHIMGIPEEGEILLEAFSSEKSGKNLEIEGISLLGNPNKVSWKLDVQGLHINQPDGELDEAAQVYKITCFEI